MFRHIFRFDFLSAAVAKELESPSPALHVLLLAFRAEASTRHLEAIPLSGKRIQVHTS